MPISFPVRTQEPVVVRERGGELGEFKFLLPNANTTLSGTNIDTLLSPPDGYTWKIHQLTVNWVTGAVGGNRYPQIQVRSRVGTDPNPLIVFLPMAEASKNWYSHSLPNAPYSTWTNAVQTMYTLPFPDCEINNDVLILVRLGGAQAGDSVGVRALIEERKVI